MSRKTPISIYHSSHVFEMVHERIDIHGQIIRVYRCKVCGVRAKQYSPRLRPDRALININQKECNYVE